MNSQRLTEDLKCTELSLSTNNFQQIVLKHYPNNTVIEELKDQLDTIREDIKLRMTFEDLNKESQKIVGLIEKFKSELVDYDKLDKIQELFEKQLYTIKHIFEY